jgi:hypothetical protein
MDKALYGVVDRDAIHEIVTLANRTAGSLYLMTEYNWTENDKAEWLNTALGLNRDNPTVTFDLGDSNE